MSSRPDPHVTQEPHVTRDPHGGPAPAGDPSEPVPPADPVAPVNPGAWDTRSWTLVDAVDGPPSESGPEPLDGGDAPGVVWPEADHGEAPELDADGVPLAEPPTGPLHAVDAPTAERPVRRRARATPTRAPRPAPPAPETRLDTGEVPAATADGSSGERRRGLRIRAGTPGRGPANETDDVRPAPPDPGARVPFAGEPGAGARAGDPVATAARAEPSDAPAPGRLRKERIRRPATVAGREPGEPGGASAVGGPKEPPQQRRAPRGAPQRAAKADPGDAPGRTRRRGGSADPVRELMHRHRALCERAVDPLEIAAGLEAHGITDRTAARYRHRDVFSLAEELFVRVPRADDAAAPGETGERRPGRLRIAGRALGHLLPGALCTATVAGLHHVPQEPPYARPAVGLLGALAVLTAVRLSLRGVPRTRTAGLWACWLLGYVLYGDWLLTELLAGDTRAERLLPALGCLCAPLALAVAVAPAAWCAHLFAGRARRRLAGSRSLGDFAAGVRPLLLLTVGLFTVALLGVQAVAHLAVRGTVPPHATLAATAALGVLLFVALLLSAHGFPRPASAGLATACLLVAAALGSVLAARLPDAAAVARPVEEAVAAYGPAVVPTVACTAAAAVLLVYALRALTGASAHQRRYPARRPGPPQARSGRPDR